MKSNLEILDVGEVHVKRPQLLITGGNGLVGSQLKSELKIDSKIDLRNRKICDDFFNKNDIDSFNMIHKGKSGTSLTYVIGEYLSDKKIYKILIFVDTKKSGNKIREIKIDQKE